MRKWSCKRTGTLGPVLFFINEYCYEVGVEKTSLKAAVSIVTVGASPHWLSLFCKKCSSTTAGVLWKHLPSALPRKPQPCLFLRKCMLYKIYDNISLRTKDLDINLSHKRQILIKTIYLSTHGIIHLLSKVIPAYLTKIHFINVTSWLNHEINIAYIHRYRKFAKCTKLQNPDNARINIIFLHNIALTIKRIFY